MENNAIKCKDYQLVFGGNRRMNDVIVTRDNTKFTDNEKKINSDNTKFECLNFLPDAVLVQKDGRVIYANDELYNILLYNNILGKSVIELLKLEEEIEVSDDINIQHNIRDGEYKIKNFQSDLIDVDIKSNIKQLEGSLYEFIIVRDITAKKKKYDSIIKQDYINATTSYKSEENRLRLELLESKELYKKLIDILPDGISIHDGITYSFVSDSYVKILGYNSPKDLIGKSIKQVTNHKDHQLMKEKINAPLSDDKKFPRAEYKFVTKQGEIIDVESTSIRFLHNNKLNILSSIRSISNKKEAEESKLLLEKTIEYDKLKTEFFSNMSHELRTPLNILLSSLQLIGMFTDCENSINLSSIRKYTGIMKQNCYRLLRLINNFLDITKIDSGFYKLDMCNHDIVKIVEDITQSVAEYIKEKDIEVIFDTDIEEKIIGCDADKIERVILNLLSNAVKFTKAGGRIEVSIYDLSDCINITVRDTGSGIPEDKINSIFDRFIQVDKSLSRRSEGTGIGLALVKSLIDMHGGNISVISEYGEYTQFDIILPVKIINNEEELSLCHATVNNNLDNTKIERMSVEFSDIYL